MGESPSGALGGMKQGTGACGGGLLKNFARAFTMDSDRTI
jgi:hypothetical protein